MHGHLEVRFFGRIYPLSLSFFVLTRRVDRWMFDCCRVPGSDGKDRSVTYAREGDIGDSGHVVLIRKGRFWRLDPFKDGKLLSSQDLER